MTGIRSWTAEVTAFGVVVNIEQVFIQLPLGLSSDPTVRRKRITPLH